MGASSPPFPSPEHKQFFDSINSKKLTTAHLLTYSSKTKFVTFSSGVGVAVIEKDSRGYLTMRLNARKFSKSIFNFSAESDSHWREVGGAIQNVVKMRKFSNFIFIF